MTAPAALPLPRNQRKPTRPIVAVAGQQAHPSGVAPHHHAEAVELYLVDPARARRWAISGRRKARLDKRGHTHAENFRAAAPAANKGAATEAAPLARVLEPLSLTSHGRTAGHLSGSDRAARCPAG